MTPDPVIQQMLNIAHPWLLHIATILGVLLALLLVSHILRSPRAPAVTMGWLLIIILVPVIGIPLYLVFGARKIKAVIKHKTPIAMRNTADTHDHPVHSLLVSLGIPASSSMNQIHFHQDGREAYRELLSLLDSAQQTIDIAIFILGNDSVGREILSHLEHRAAQGVKIRLLLDGVGSFLLPKSMLHALIKKGGQVAWFIPVLHRPWRGRTNLRNHRKIIIVDRHKVWTGGRNLAAEYLGPNCPDRCWIDLSFCQQGSATATYLDIFNADWHFATKTPVEEPIVVTHLEAEGKSRMQVVPSGPDVADDPIYAAILTACYEAHDRILIVTPYYVPDVGIQEALRLAALRGIIVDLILPEKSNHRLADIARNRYLRTLIQAGARIWFLPGTMVHAKALVVDDRLAMAGSANLDIRSLFLNCEVMSIFYSRQDIEWLARWLESLQNQANRHFPEPVGEIREMVEGLVTLAAYQL